MAFFGTIKFLFKIAYRLLFDYPKNFSFLEKRIAFHTNSEIDGDRSFNRKKLRFYSGVATISYTCLESLSGQKTSAAQKEAMLLICCVSPIVDDLMDEKGYSPDEARQLTDKVLQRNSIEEKVVVALLDDLDERAPGIRQSEIWAKAIEFQTNSGQSADRLLSEKELEELTFGKGGNIVLLGMLACQPKLVSTKTGQSAFYNIGGLVQLVDDICDVYFDVKDGQQTLATNSRDLNALSSFFNKKIEETIELLLKIPLERARVETFLFEMKCLTTLGRLALNNLMEIHGNRADVFDPKNYSRQQLVPDLATWRNRLKYLRLVLFKPFPI